MNNTQVRANRRSPLQRFVLRIASSKEKGAHRKAIAPHAGQT
ncbi:hypothetical protein [Leptolyngbya sp. FACHB-541]|nr:hypothetical protein [Leptolyngbya sp. FACHB-541]